MKRCGLFVTYGRHTHYISFVNRDGSLAAIIAFLYLSPLYLYLSFSVQMKVLRPLWSLHAMTITQPVRRRSKLVSISEH